MSDSYGNTVFTVNTAGTVLLPELSYSYGNTVFTVNVAGAVQLLELSDNYGNTVYYVRYNNRLSLLLIAFINITIKQSDSYCINVTTVTTANSQTVTVLM